MLEYKKWERETSGRGGLERGVYIVSTVQYKQQPSTHQLPLRTAVADFNLPAILHPTSITVTANPKTCENPYWFFSDDIKILVKEPLNGSKKVFRVELGWMEGEAYRNKKFKGLDEVTDSAEGEGCGPPKDWRRPRFLMKVLTYDVSFQIRYVY